MKTLGIDTGLGNAVLVKTPKAQTTKFKKKTNNTSVSETKPQLKASAQQKKQSTRWKATYSTGKNICKPYTE